MNCKKCGAVVEESSKFCGQCGERTASTNVAYPVTGVAKECPACHEKVTVSKSVCPHCGRRFDIEELRKASANSPKDGAVGIGVLVVLVGFISVGLYSWVHKSSEEQASDHAQSEYNARLDDLKAKADTGQAPRAYSRNAALEEQIATILNLNGLLCARVVSVKPLEVRPNNYEVRCVEYQGGLRQVRYILDAAKGTASKA